jgi:hypothetical protein
LARESIVDIMKRWFAWGYEEMRWHTMRFVLQFKLLVSILLFVS